MANYNMLSTAKTTIAAVSTNLYTTSGIGVTASCERVFALLRNLFGELQMRSLADYVQAALMLNYNQRNVG